MKIFVLAIPSLLLFNACGHESRQTEAAPAAAPIRVSTVAVAAGDWPNLYEAMGTVQARTSAVVSSKVLGYVREVRVRVGDRVSPDQVLVVLDARDLDAAYRQADAQREEVNNAVPEADNAVAGAKANLDLAQVTFKRMQDLFDKKSISNQEMDEATAKLKAAQAAHAMAQSKRAQLASKMMQVEQGRRTAEITRGYAQIRAPFAGIVTAKTVEPGILATPGAPLLTLEREGSFRLEVPVEEARLPSIRAGQPVSVGLEALGKTVEARVSEVVPAVDAASRAYTVKIDLPGLAQLRSGIFGRAQFPLGTRRVMAVPAAAVEQRGQLQSVWLADDGVARTRLVTVGQKSGDKAEVLSGLTAGENVIFPVPPGLADGARVEVRP